MIDHGRLPLIFMLLGLALPVNHGMAQGQTDRAELARAAFQSAIECYENNRENEALAHVETLLHLYEAEARRFPQAVQLREDLRRRKSHGTLGKPSPAELPKDFAKLAQEEQIAFLIESLELVNAVQLSEPGSLNIESDCRVEALLNIREAAIPVLIATVEKDERLTRTVNSHSRIDPTHVITVREVASAVAVSILGVRNIDPRDPSADPPCLFARDPARLKKSAALLRKYWSEFGRMPFEERMMRVLTDTKSSFAAKREAADNLGGTGTKLRGFGYDSNPAPFFVPGLAPKAARPAINRFQAPTAAEAILSAMDRDPTDNSYFDLGRDAVEDSYLFPLIALGDRRIVPELAKRAANSDLHMRRKWCLACFHLGNPKPLQTLAEDITTGKTRIPNDSELSGIIFYFTNVSLPETDRALFAMTDPKHPAYKRALAAVLDLQDERTVYSTWESWHVSFLTHPYCLAILGRALDDKTPTGTILTISADRLHTKSGMTSFGSVAVPECLRQAKNRKERAEERRCDRAAGILSRIVLGSLESPEYLPLFADADDRILAMKQFFQRFDGRFRTLTSAERDVLSLTFMDNIHFVPDIRPLRQPASAEDVKAGKAIFHLGGKGKQTKMALPACGIWKNPGMRGDPSEHVGHFDGTLLYNTLTAIDLQFITLVPTTTGASVALLAWAFARPVLGELLDEHKSCLIMQAEVGPGGRVVFGIIEPHAIRSLPAAELVAFPLPPGQLR